MDVVPIVLENLFWLSLILIAYAYFGYPCILWIISLGKTKTVTKAPLSPCVSFIITAHNEASTIIHKLENTLSLTYPKDKLQIIVASDASSDATDTLVLNYIERGVELVRTEERKGKENAQQHAVEKARGDILIFSDVAAMLSPDAIVNIVSNFNDPSIGCVSSIDRFIDGEGTISGEGMYVKYEMFLRILESKVNSLVGLSGSFFAARKEVCTHWRTDLQSDFNTLLNSVKLGLRGVSDATSVGYYKTITNEHREFDRKVRTVLRGITVFMNNLNVLNPRTFGLFSWQLVSHKLMRWLVPLFLLIALTTNGVLAWYSETYLVILLMQGAFYLAAYLFHNSKNRLLKIPYFFLNVNRAIACAWIQYLKGTRMHYWTPSER